MNARNEQERQAVLDTLANAWRRAPYLRLGQLIGNAYGTGPALFEVTDEELSLMLCAFKPKTVTGEER